MAATTAVRTFAIDKAHSEAVFQVRHLVTRVRGRFSDFAGTIQFNEASPENSTADVTIQAATIDTNQADRDTHLRSADFFSVEQYPTLTFKSTKVTKTGSETLDVTGDLTIRGVTKPVTLKTTFLGLAKDPWGNLRAGFEAEVTINRKDFGLMWNATLETGGFLVGDEVKISLSVQAVAQ
ncbi:MAG TPA: YceI family protein [Vicinamibacterales bacterium]|jgi:polyisoprenoid-binding protein YceI